MQEHPELYEHSDVNPRGIFIFLAGLFAGLVLVAVVLWLTFRLLESRVPKAEISPLPSAGEMPPEPRIQIKPAWDMKALRAEEDKALKSGPMPIEKAMELLVQKGLPVREEKAR